MPSDLGGYNCHCCSKEEEEERGGEEKNGGCVITSKVIGLFDGLSCEVTEMWVKETHSDGEQRKMRATLYLQGLISGSVTAVTKKGYL